jgi:hypothetical protein
MNTVKARTLKPHEGFKLQRMKRQLVNHVNSRHARIILLSRGGWANARIAQHGDCTPTWVRQILHRFNAGGIEAIAWYPYYCSPVGSISLEWLRQLLHRRRIHWRHTQTWKDSNDPQCWPKYRRIRRLYRRRPEGGRRLCVDEFGPLNLPPRHGKHYARTGHVERRRATYRRTGGVRHLFAAYDMESDTLIGSFAARKNWTTFLPFLKSLRRRYRSEETLQAALLMVKMQTPDDLLHNPIDARLELLSNVVDEVFARPHPLSRLSEEKWTRCAGEFDLFIHPASKARFLQRGLRLFRGPWRRRCLTSGFGWGVMTSRFRRRRRFHFPPAFWD